MYSANFEVNDDGYIQGNSLRRGCGTIEIRSPDNVRLVPHCFCFCFVFCRCALASRDNTFCKVPALKIFVNV